MVARIGNIEIAVAIHGQPAGVVQLRGACSGTIATETRSPVASKGRYPAINGDPTDAMIARVRNKEVARRIARYGRRNIQLGGRRQCAVATIRVGSIASNR